MARTRSKNKHRGKVRKKGLPWYLWLVIALGVAGAVIGIRTCNSSGQTDSTQSGELKAAIIDQLYVLDPNQDFIHQATSELEDYGFKVDVYHGEEVTVDLYSQLPANGYKLIVFRAHAGLLGHEEDLHVEGTDATFLFTGETYYTTERVWEQLFDQILPAKMTDDYPMVFAVNSRFVKKSIEGEFQNTVIIMMGCSSAYQSDMAEAFIEKGASVYLGWSATVDLDYVDTATLEIINNLCTKGMPIEEALAKTVAEVGLDPYYHAQPKYYPSGAGNETIIRLVR